MSLAATATSGTGAGWVSSTILTRAATPTSGITMATGYVRQYASAAMMEGCHAPTSGISSMYGYDPTLAAGIAICLLFGLSFSAHVIRGIQLCRWTSFMCILGALSETSKCDQRALACAPFWNS
jgi:hypothetical protein